MSARIDVVTCRELLASRKKAYGNGKNIANSPVVKNNAGMLIIFSRFVLGPAIGI